MASYPALDVRGLDGDVALALVDDWGPIAAESGDDGLITIFFSTPDHRDNAALALASGVPSASLRARDVEDEGWAARSQAALGPVTIGRITVTPPWALDTSKTAPVYKTRPVDASSGGHHVVVVIQPSMGFGTGHHATTRLCLAALQDIPLAGATVLDLGTGSGVLALAAHRLGAALAIGIDVDPDAIRSALENHELNGSPATVRFRVADLRDAALPASLVVVANLTGSMLERQAGRLRELLAPGGTLVVSGLTANERDAVVRALTPLVAEREALEAEWVCLVFRAA